MGLRRDGVLRRIVLVDPRVPSLCFPVASPKSKENGEELVQMRFKAPDKVAYEGDRPNHWLTLENGKPSGIRRYAGPLVLDKEYVTAQVRYTSIGQGEIMPPPGNPIAVPETDFVTSELNQTFVAMQAGLWDVKATVSATKSVVVRGLIRGRDFDLVMEPQNGGDVIRQIAIRGEGWMSNDGGKSWKTVDAEDRLPYQWVQSPIQPGGNLPPFEIVGKETRDAVPMLHLRLKVPEALGSEKERPHYWLGLDSADRPNNVRRYVGDVAMPGGQVVRCEVDYRSASADATIVPPPRNLIKAAKPTTSALLPAPFEGKSLGFFAIDEQKARIDGRIIAVEITGQVLQSESVGENQFRLMVKDTDKRYGLIEISGDGMRKLGLTGKGASKPLTLYLRITNLGPKPAARATVVGAKFVAVNEKEGTYSWD
jgi:hypothetical protein